VLHIVPSCNVLHHDPVPSANVIHHFFVAGHGSAFLAILLVLVPAVTIGLVVFGGVGLVVWLFVHLFGFGLLLFALS
jgi:hypothetical protein